MKKAIALLMAVTMVFACVSLTGCGGGDADYSDSEYVGTWIGSDMSLGDESESMDDIVLVVSADGTGTLTGEGETSEFTWEPTDEGFKTKGDLKVTFKGDSEKITAKVLGVNLNFVKQ